MRQEPNTRSIQHDWGARVKVGRVGLAERRARQIGVSREEIARSLQMTFDGIRAGLYRDGEDLLPILLRPPKAQREGVSNLQDAQVWSAVAGRAVPVAQVTDGVESGFEDPVIHRRNRMRTITVSCQQRTGTADALFRKMRPRVDALALPAGYQLEWGGQQERSKEANTKLLRNVPIAFALMFFITVLLFNTLRHPIIIFLGLPLAVIGVSVGLVLTQEPFNFVATLGFLSLSGMLIKNEVVLLEQINLDLEAGNDKNHQNSPTRAQLNSLTEAT